MNQLEGTKETQTNTPLNSPNKDGEKRSEDLQQHYSKQVAGVLAPEENEKIRNGVIFLKCQMDRIVEEYKRGDKVEFEALSPYLADYNMATGEMWPDKLTKSDAIGLAISKLLRDAFEKARLISLYDEYNSGMPDSENDYGAPTKNGPQMVFSEEIKAAFRKSVEELLRAGGAIGKNDKEGENYLFVSESSKVTAAEKLVEKLEANGNIRRDGQSIYFVNPEAENPNYREVILRTKSGRWLCEALDASSYLDEQNLKITHLVVLPNQFVDQQNKVWEILRTLGIKPTNYHNIFYDENVSPETIVDTISQEIETYMGKSMAGNGVMREAA